MPGHQRTIRLQPKTACQWICYNLVVDIHQLRTLVASPISSQNPPNTLYCTNHLLGRGSARSPGEAKKVGLTGRQTRRCSRKHRMSQQLPTVIGFDQELKNLSELVEFQVETFSFIRTLKRKDRQRQQQQSLLHHSHSL